MYYFVGIRLFWWTTNNNGGKDNFGDILSKFLVEKLTNRKIIKVPHPSMRRYKLFLKHYLTIGSILEVANSNSIVWGSGIIRENQFVREAKFLAVRGPRTRSRLLELGYKVPEIYGDPAILLPLYLQKKVEKKYKIGIIPHYINYEEVLASFGNDDRIKIIDLMTDDVERTISEILECENIISSSLHGVIVSQAYSIPSLWVKFSEKLAGDNVKFYDYFESVGITYESEFQINPLHSCYEELLNRIEANRHLLLPDNILLAKRQDSLLKSCPF
ncbi:xanthan biosynthesis pyruvyl transferase GumL [Flavobacterium enshiense DK69]|uniref:Polysaccharide pyruvyl transferase domain-containing protein n=2 Tax=Flavobacterium TaxID=237 RepID=V6SCR8_9FLAO|nr:polysaccharide pyruvyl transferase family protein [Flavobacterium enshiense]ESU22180.1 xanthan biosynthesis pyruvyl transferase GumL [Flavobacterium enshiense DK69]KGO97192.1 hypothetical protein Q767_00890 [Flavobacterium enshiense DK69]